MPSREQEPEQLDRRERVAAGVVRVVERDAVPLAERLEPVAPLGGLEQPERVERARDAGRAVADARPRERVLHEREVEVRVVRDEDGSVEQREKLGRELGERRRAARPPRRRSRARRSPRRGSGRPAARGSRSGRARRPSASSRTTASETISSASTLVPVVSTSTTAYAAGGATSSVGGRGRAAPRGGERRRGLAPVAAMGRACRRRRTARIAKIPHMQGESALGRARLTSTDGRARPASSTNRQTALTSRICATVAQSASRSARRADEHRAALGTRGRDVEPVAGRTRTRSRAAPPRSSSSPSRRTRPAPAVPGTCRPCRPRPRRAAGRAACRTCALYGATTRTSLGVERPRHAVLVGERRPEQLADRGGDRARPPRRTTGRAPRARPAIQRAPLPRARLPRARSPARGRAAPRSTRPT